MAPPRAITHEGKLRVPAEIVEKLGGPGTVIEFEEDGDRIIMRRGKSSTFEDIHKILFPNGPPGPETVEEMDEGIADHLRKKHARR